MTDRHVAASKKGGRAGWLIGAVVVIVIALAAYFYFNGSFSGYGTTTGPAGGDTEIVLPGDD